MHFPKNENKKALAKTGAFIASVGAVALGATLLSKKGVQALQKHAKPVYDFVQKESKVLAEEINSSKLGKFFEEKFTPCSNKTCEQRI